MAYAKEILKLNASVLFPVPESGTGADLAGDALRTLYEGFNGGYFWEGALLVRPLVPVGTELPATIARWNEPGLWKGRYGPPTQGVVFFAEDVFGIQYGVSQGPVLQFDPETGEITECGATLADWAQRVSQDADFFTGLPVLRGWERRHGKLATGFRLVPKKLFMLGGDFHSENMIARPEVEGMLVRAELWAHTRDIPDGQQIIFTKSE